MLNDAGLLVAIPSFNALYRIDPISGNRTILSATAVGDGPAFDRPCGLVLGSNGKVLVTDTLSQSLFEVDLATGNRVSVANTTTGIGPVI